MSATDPVRDVYYQSFTPAPIKTLSLVSPDGRTFTYFRPQQFSDTVVIVGRTRNDHSAWTRVVLATDAARDYARRLYRKGYKQVGG